MAKSVHEKKKRIARITSLDNHEYHDIVSSIMNGMDNNLPSTYSNKFESDLFESQNTFSKKKAQNTEILNAKQCMSVPKSKKFGLSRKFPLMEKSQRALKQIRHNRKIPKPRAHLAGLSDSPLNFVSNEKSKINKVKEKNIEQIQNKKLTNKTVHRKVTASGNEGNKKLVEEPKNKIAFKKKNPDVMNKNETIKKSCNLLNNSNKESGDSSSDAEFERFIRHEKKDLPKTQKSTKKRSLSTSKKVCKKRACTKNISRPAEREKYSDTSDEELPKPNKRITNKREILRNRQSRASVEKSSESEMDVCNETYHDSSSESDGVDHMSANDSCGSQLYEQEGYKPVTQLHSHLQKTAVSSLVNNNNNQPSTSCAVSLIENNQPIGLFNASHSLLVNNQLNLMHKVCNVSSVANNSQSKTHITPLVSNDKPNIPHTASLMADNSQPSTIVKSESFGVCDIKNDPVSVISSSSKNSDQSLLIDLAESDDECENTFTITPKIVAVSGPNQNELGSHSDESEIEIVDVVVHDIPQKSKKNVKPQSPKENILIKAETVNQTANILNKTVKNELRDDCEIIFDAASTSNGTKMTNVQKCSNSNIKKEKDSEKLALSALVTDNSSFAPEKKNKLAQKEERLHEVACSNLRNIANMHKGLEPERIGDLHSIDIKSLLEALKKEFSTYKEIIQTEQSVEATFKLLERRQAEKLTLLKSQIAQHLESSGISDNCNAIKNVMTSLLDSQLSSYKSLKDSIQDVSLKSDISVEDLNNLASMKIVPLSSISTTDIKPNISELCTLKQEDSVTYETNNMSFGEKCTVCSKEASAACQQCAKVFFCSNECGVKYWENGHKNTCVKK